MSWSPCCTLHFLAWTLLLCLVAAHTRTPAFSAPNSPTFTGSNSWNPVPPGRDISTNQFSSVTGPIASLSFSLALPCREKRGARQRDGSQKQCRERWHPRCFSRFESCREQQNPRESFCFGTLQRCSVDALRVTKERRTVGRRIVFFGQRRIELKRDSHLWHGHLASFWHLLDEIVAAVVVNVHMLLHVPLSHHARLPKARLCERVCTVSTCAWRTDRSTNPILDADPAPHAAARVAERDLVPTRGCANVSSREEARA
jgi:hypothetical protein